MSADLPRASGSGDDAPYRPSGERFSHVRFREGYAMDEVDAFFETIMARTEDEVRAVRFGTKRLGTAYDMHEVDDSLDRWERRLRG